MFDVAVLLLPSSSIHSRVAQSYDEAFATDMKAVLGGWQAGFKPFL